jgi:hypothetical protein
MTLHAPLRQNAEEKRQYMFLFFKTRIFIFLKHGSSFSEDAHGRCRGAA